MISIFQNYTKSGVLQQEMVDIIVIISFDYNNICFNVKCFYSLQTVHTHKHKTWRLIVTSDQ